MRPPLWSRRAVVLVAALVFAGARLAAQPCGGWSWTHPLPQGNNLAGAAFGNGLYVTVGEAGTLMTSPDGAAWEARTLAPNVSLSGVTWSGSQFVVVGSGGAIFTSPDGLSWAPRASGTTDLLSAVTWSGTRFVAVGGYFSSERTIVTSPDGITWTPRNPPPGDALTGVAWNGSRFVAVGESGEILVSPGGASWSAVASGTSNPLYSVAAGNGLLVAVGPFGTILTSPDGLAWNVRTSPGGGLLSVVWTGTQFAAVGAISGASPAVLTSPDGLVWTTHGVPGAVIFNLRAIAWGASGFVAAGFGGLIATSPDGIAWTTRVSGAVRDLRDVLWDGERFVAVGGINIVLTSPDGLRWTRHSLSIVPAILHGLARSPSRFVAVGSDGTVVTSENGTAWTARDAGLDTFLSDVVWTGSQFVAVGELGTILTSPDGAVWTLRDSGTVRFLLSVAWGGGQLIAVGEEGLILTSPDGATWTSRVSGTTDWLTGVAWGNGVFVAAGSGFGFVTSPNGVVWTQRDADVDFSFDEVAWNGTEFFAVGAVRLEHGQSSIQAIATSADGVSWDVESVGVGSQIWAAAWGPSNQVLVGDYGAILTRLCACAESSTAACLSQGRFKIEAEWDTPGGISGKGQAVRLTGDTTYFWFFDDDNVEIVAKVLDGCPVSDRFWVFAGGLTDVGVRLRVTDTATGETKVYRNSRGTRFQPIQDTAAFATCSTPAVTNSALLPAPPPPASPITGTCAGSETALCLSNGRFQVEAEWRTAAGQTGTGMAVPLTGDTGYFWFFGAENVEAIVKVLNACEPFDRFWVFAGGLTDVRVILNITDTATGERRTYRNPLRTPFQPIQDTNAFATCQP